MNRATHAIPVWRSNGARHVEPVVFVRYGRVNGRDTWHYRTLSPWPTIEEDFYDFAPLPPWGLRQTEWNCGVRMTDP